MNAIRMRVMLALASIAAGAIHFVVTPEHFEEYTLFGAFFLALGVFQVLWGGAILLQPNRFVLIGGILANAAVIGIWVLSRTAGLPIGPEAGEREAVGLLDTLSTALEAVIVLGGTYLLARGVRPEERVERPALEREPRAA